MQQWRISPKQYDATGSLLTMTVYLQNFEDYPYFKKVYADWIDTDNLLARATERAGFRDPALLVEIMAVVAAGADNRGSLDENL